MKKNLFICGCRGMAGHTIYNWFKNYTFHLTYGIARENSDFHVDVENNLEDL